MLATANATDPDDLSLYSPEIVEAMLRKTYTRLGKREGKSHLLFDFEPEKPGSAESIEIFSTDMPFIVDSVLAAIRAKGGVIRFMSHPVLHLDPESHRLLDDAAPVSVNESLLLVHIEPVAEPEQRAAILAEIEGTLTEVYRATRAWRTMLERLRRVVEDWKLNPPKAAGPAIQEAKEFLGWLAEHNFTFLGMREYRLDGEGKEAKFVPLGTSGIGILEDKDFHFLRAGTDYVEMTEQHIAWLGEPDPLMVTKANVRTRVHRRAYMDYVGVKLYREGGEVSGELRIIGLFTSMALATPHTEVPLIRRKVSEVMRRWAYPAGSHAGKALMAALESYPRDELFQISEDQLFAFAKEIAALADRPRVRVLPRIDRFDNFVSVLVYVPRDRYNSDAREKIGLHLAKVYDGRVSAYYPSFPEGELVRVHFIVGRNGGPTPRPDRDDLEAAVAGLTLTFGDRLAAAAPEGRDVTGWLGAFSAAYQQRNSAADALADIAVIEKLEGDTSLALKLTRRGPSGDGAYGLKVYHRGRPIPLSDRVPMLENFGFRVIDERTYTVEPTEMGVCFIHDMVLDVTGARIEDFAARAPLVEAAILAVWQTDAESDGLNQLTLRAGLAWYDVAILRALVRYLRQIGVTWSRAYLAQVLNLHPDVARALVELFHSQLDMGFSGNRERAVSEAHEAIATALEATQSLDEDRIIRRLLNLIDAAVRTNAFQRDGAGHRRPALAIKFDCSKIEGLPEPRPFREIFVYSPRVEGLHLRFGPIARGGLRWSDRPEDFRTEVLGLVKAQQVKNAIIVPVGAKGAFVPRMMPIGADRETVLAEGTACYKIFVQTLLDVTDNLEGDVVLPPPDVRRRDGDDPYLVVAADKGTATFSDTANAIALERGFWLGDAFASGGSNGYDHKKMGITAKGAWEAVKRHFRELDRDIQASPFTVVGVGDMSGDVFGNGMLLSPQIRLIAAFDHRDIFIDPDPDPDQKRTMAERQRLFELPRSSWQDYDKKLLSKGGGVYSRSLKNVALFAEGPQGARPRQRSGDAAGGDRRHPQGRGRSALVRGYRHLCAWLRRDRRAGRRQGQRRHPHHRPRHPRQSGGRRRQSRGDAEGPHRLRAAWRPHRHRRHRQLRRRQRLGHRGQRQDRHELCGAHRRPRPGGPQRLPRADDRRGGGALPPQQLSAAPRHVAGAARGGRRPARPSCADREPRGARPAQSAPVEFLPDDATLDARALAGKTLTRPELATILAYAKNSLYADLLDSRAPDDAYLSHELFKYFPPTLNRALPRRGHRPPPAPRGDRHRYRQRHHQPWRSGVCNQDDGLDLDRPRPGGGRLHAGTRRLRTGTAL